METTTAVSTWHVDGMHSEVQFKIKHLVISTVTGVFKKFEGSMHTASEDFDGAKVTFKIEAGSIDTNVADRDAHLRSSDFFDVETYPHITFANGILTKTDVNTYELHGDLTIKNVSKKVALKATYGGTMVDSYGYTKAGFEVEGKINRKDYGLTWSMVTEAGGVVVSDEVRLIFNIQLAKA